MAGALEAAVAPRCNTRMIYSLQLQLHHTERTAGSCEGFREITKLLVVHRENNEMYAPRWDISAAEFFLNAGMGGPVSTRPRLFVPLINAGLPRRKMVFPPPRHDPGEMLSRGKVFTWRFYYGFAFCCNLIATWGKLIPQENEKGRHEVLCPGSANEFSSKVYSGNLIIDLEVLRKYLNYADITSEWFNSEYFFFWVIWGSAYFSFEKFDNLIRSAPLLIIEYC